jgi:hypothetical protein
MVQQNLFNDLRELYDLYITSPTQTILDQKSELQQKLVSLQMIWEKALKELDMMTIVGFRRRIYSLNPMGKVDDTSYGEKGDVSFKLQGESWHGDAGANATIDIFLLRGKVPQGVKGVTTLKVYQQPSDGSEKRLYSIIGTDEGLFEQEFVEVYSPQKTMWNYLIYCSKEGDSIPVTGLAINGKLVMGTCKNSKAYDWVPISGLDGASQLFQVCVGLKD